MVKCILYAHGHVAPTVSYSTGYLALGPHTPPVVRGVLNQHPLDVQAINLVWLLDQLFGPEAWTHLLDSWTP
ncbi:hypothetical protein EON65_18080 [archaeon]|nr:MAG: hypothetical protein EON65_18080 [archaeon]